MLSTVTPAHPMNKRKTIEERSPVVCLRARVMKNAATTTARTNHSPLVSAVINPTRITSSTRATSLLDGLASGVPSRAGLTEKASGVMIDRGSRIFADMRILSARS